MDNTTKEDGKTVVAYKGFNQSLQCRGFQYEIGNTYTHEGDVKSCHSGFHACEHPLDVFGYYPPSGSRFAVVELSGKTDGDSSDIKLAAATITIKAEIQLHEMIERAVQWVFARAKKTKKSSCDGNGESASATGDWGAASATGDWGAASATGYNGAASATGYNGAASATGDWGAAMASGHEGRVSGREGNALFLVERNDDYEIVNVWAGIAGRDGIRPDTFYILKDGNPVEV